MPQISLYVNQNDYDKIVEAARFSGKSISNWVAEAVRPKFRQGYSQEFLDLFGSVQDESFRRPEQPDASLNAPREEML